MTMLTKVGSRNRSLSLQLKIFTTSGPDPKALTAGIDPIDPVLCRVLVYRESYSVGSGSTLRETGRSIRLGSVSLPGPVRWKEDWTSLHVTSEGFLPVRSVTSFSWAL